MFLPFCPGLVFQEIFETEDTFEREVEVVVEEVLLDDVPELFRLLLDQSIVVVGLFLPAAASACLDSSEHKENITVRSAQAAPVAPLDAPDDSPMLGMRRRGLDQDQQVVLWRRRRSRRGAESRNALISGRPRA